MITKLMNMAEMAIADSGRLIPMFLTLNGKGDIVPENPLISATLGKMIIDAVKGNGPMMLPLFKGDVAIFMAEVWTRKVEPGAREEVRKLIAGEMKVSESPEKEEAVIIHVQTRNNGYSVALGKIQAGPDGKKSIPEWGIMKTENMAGAIPEILKKCVA